MVWIVFYQGNCLSDKNNLYATWKFLRLVTTTGNPSFTFDTIIYKLFTFFMSPKFVLVDIFEESKHSVADAQEFVVYLFTNSS